ncbi:hypothetical protein J2Z44_003851 [Clostridium punense]|uniref:Phage protein n=1 Tax=Clostridium punense TaxID=1054297 RepID=A0ABS4K9Z3_9CLOT|nr:MULTISPECIES: hypothetical protein [Clostridium]EQB89634.1 hypothetical protein M918_19775 [Clostridium sp. BL8]MBP2024001.1 hypothetical protein [Clostridium punense]
MKMLTITEYQYLTWQFKLKRRDDEKAINELDEVIDGIDVEYLGWQFEGVSV